MSETEQVGLGPGDAAQGIDPSGPAPEAERPDVDAHTRRTHPAVPGSGVAALALGALGVVFGDIGTSPLYAVQTVFALDHHAVKQTTSDVYGVISLIFWSVTLVVSVKYVAFILRADNDGEGGVMALAALARRATPDRGRMVSAALLLGVLGASLFYGDSVITPSISVLSAVEGLKVVSPSLSDVVLPLGIAILAILFLIQRFGTHAVGRIFGPTMLLWFFVLVLLGIPQIVHRPSILKALSPVYIGSFVSDHPYITFIALGAVVLAITGAEALYADMGHFGKPPIRRAWFFVVFPALIINYLGQGALVLRDPQSVGNPFYNLAPGWSRIPMVILATGATIIASQAVISGAFSVSRQAVRLGYLPNLAVRHTSTKERGQIYVPAVNWVLFGAVLIVIVLFRSSSRLATAYGLAVTATFVITTTLFITVAARVWGWARWRLVLIGLVFGTVEVFFFAANVTKVASGGWLPLLMAVAVTVTMTTWQRGRQIVTARRIKLEGSLDEFVEEMRRRDLPRVPGVAVFPHPSKDTTPLALRSNVDFNKVLHEHVVLISVQPQNIPYVAREDRIEIDSLSYTDDGIVHLTARFGFQDEQDLPDLLRQAVGMSEELNFDPEEALYFLSRLSLEHGQRGGSDERSDLFAGERRMWQWRKRLFIAMAHNAANPAASFHLPENRTILVGAHLEV